MPAFVPPSTSIRRNRAHNVDTDRLRARRAYLLASDPSTYESRVDFAVRAYELQAIEDVLVDRAALPRSERRTLART